MHTCKHCKKELKSLDALRIHSSKVHKLPSQQIYDEYFLNGERPKCKCGCGEDVPFITLQKGYREWIRGHKARVQNNWGHNSSAIEKSANTRREQFKNGERHVWNIGLTKEKDDRVKQYGVKSSYSIQSNSSEMFRRSNHMKQQWIDGTMKVKWGIESANWKGGTSSINNLVRANKRLYTDWIYPILVRDGFKCVKCESTKKLEVHHNKETMSEILSEFVDKECEYTFDEKRYIMNKVIDYHVSNDISGETLCLKCHSKLHPSYNLE
jgi:hypothetical protein